MRVTNESLHRQLKFFGFDVPHIDEDKQALILDLIDARAEIDRLNHKIELLQGPSEHG